MKLLRVGPEGAERPAVLAEDGTLLDLSGVTRDIDADFLATGLDDARTLYLPAGGAQSADWPARWASASVNSRRHFATRSPASSRS